MGIDALLMVASLFAARAIHGALYARFPIHLKASPPDAEFARLLLVAVPAWLVLVASLGLQRLFERRWSARELAVDLLKLHTLGLLTLTFLLFVTQAPLNRSLALAFFAVSFSLMYLSRAALRRWQRYQYALGHTRRRVLLVGRGGLAMASFASALADRGFPPEVLGYIGHEHGAEGLPPYLGELDTLASLLHDGVADEVLFLPPLNEPARVAESLAICETVGIPAELAIDLPADTDAKPLLVDRAGQPFIRMDVAPKSPHALSMKYALDFVLAGLGLIAISPLLLIIGCAIVVTMGRPIFFTQERAGLYGRRFRMFKFRTMVADAEARRDELLDRNEMDGPVFKVTGDPRVTRLGQLLRRSSLDELPQLLNVVLGSMSLVGPRPLPTREQQEMSGWRRRRLSMRPGITGLWQVSGRSDVDFDGWMKLDLRYIDHWSLLLDLKILFRTIPAVLFGRGAR